MGDACRTPIKIGLFRRAIRTDYPESSKKLGAVIGVLTLAAAVLGIGGSIAYGVCKSEKHDVGSGAVGAFVAVTVPLAGLAGFNYRKPEAKP